MSQRVKMLLKKNNALEQQLNKDNQKILTDIVVYLRVSDISQYQQELVRQDITLIMIEGQNRGETMEEVIGKDYKSFCDQILEEVPKRTLKEKIGSSIGNLCLYMCVAIICMLIMSVVRLFVVENTFPLLTIGLGTMIGYVMMILMAWVMVEYIGKTAFDNRKPRYYVIVLFGMCFFVTLVSIFFLNEITMTVSIYFVCIFLIVCFIAYKILDIIYD